MNNDNRLKELGAVVIAASYYPRGGVSFVYGFDAIGYEIGHYMPDFNNSVTTFNPPRAWAKSLRDELTILWSN